MNKRGLALDVVEVRVGTNWEVVEYCTLFDQTLAEMQEKGLELITAEQLAILRICDKRMLNSECLVAESYNYDPNGDILISSGKYNPVLRSPEAAVNAHRNRQELFPSDDLWELLRDLAKTNPEDARKTGVLLVPRASLQERIPVGSLQDVPETYFLFGNNAVHHGRWLKSNRVTDVEQKVAGADYAKEQNRPFSRILGIYGYWNNSALVGDAKYFNLSHDNRMFGIRHMPPDIAVPGR